MYVLDLIKELQDQPLPDPDKLKTLVIELNQYLEVAHQLPLNNLPPLKIIEALIGHLSDTQRYSLCMREIPIETPTTDIAPPLINKHDRQDRVVRWLVGVLGLTVAYIALISDIDKELDWAGLIYKIIDKLVSSI